MYGAFDGTQLKGRSMKHATIAMLKRDLAPFIRTCGNEHYILEKDIAVITYQVLHAYPNVYCHTEVNKVGQKVYSINSARAHKKFIEVYVRDIIHQSSTEHCEIKLG